MATDNAYRSRQQIVADILEFLQSKDKKPKKPTHVLYRCNLSSENWGNYKKVILENKFAVENDYHELEITSKGSQWLQKFRNVPEVDFVLEGDK